MYRRSDRLESRTTDRWAAYMTASSIYILPLIRSFQRTTFFGNGSHGQKSLDSMVKVLWVSTVLSAIEPIETVMQIIPQPQALFGCRHLLSLSCMHSPCPAAVAAKPLAYAFRPSGHTKKWRLAAPHPSFGNATPTLGPNISPSLAPSHLPREPRCKMRAGNDFWDF